MSKNRILKNTLVSGLTLAMLVGGSASVFAHDKGKGHAGDKVKIEIKLEFKDLGQANWARKYIASLANRKVFDGYSDGTFQPQKKVTRIEAITTAVKLMGLKDEAMTKMNADLNLKDGNKIERKYAWAVGFVEVAQEHDLISENILLQPEKPADRLWATVLLVKALGLEQEAKSKMNAQLSFTDARKIPAEFVGYVAVAVEKNLIKGYKDENGGFAFRPTTPISRAEFATMLDKTGDQLPESSDTKVVGTVSAAVSGNVLTVETKEGSKQLTLDPNAFIYRDGKKIAATELAAGDQVVVRLYNNVVFFIEVVKSAQTNTNVTGTLTDAVTNNTLSVSKDNVTTQYTLSPNAIILRDNAIVTAADLKAGDEVALLIKDNAVVFVQVTKTASVSTQFEVSGTVNTVTKNDQGVITSISLNQTVDNTTEVKVYNVSPTVTIEGDAALLVANQAVELKGADQVVTSIEVK